MDLLRATRTQVSPVYGVMRGGAAAIEADAGKPLYDFHDDGQRHILTAIRGEGDVDRFVREVASADVYIADGHHRYETALAYRDEVRARATSWSGDEAENFVLMALTRADDPGLLVLPTHRLVHVAVPQDALSRIGARFDVTEIDAAGAVDALAAHTVRTAFVALGLAPGRAHLLTLRDTEAAQTAMPAGQPAAWKELDVSVLQYAVLRDVFGIDDAALAAGGAVTYTQDAGEVRTAVAAGRARVAFLLNATPVDQVLAVADAGGRMPQKSTYFYPKLPTGLVMHALA
jgi:uncharacterized protein (DUF1015 family)